MPLAAVIALSALLIALGVAMGLAIGGRSRRSAIDDLPGGAPYDRPGGGEG